MSSLELLLIPLLGPAAIPFAIAAGVVYLGSIAYSANAEKRALEVERGAEHLAVVFDTIISALEKDMSYISEEFRPDMQSLRIRKMELIAEYKRIGGDKGKDAEITAKFNKEVENIRKNIVLAREEGISSVKENEFLVEQVAKEIEKIKGNKLISKEAEMIEIEYKTYLKFDGIKFKTEKLEKLHAKCMKILENVKNMQFSESENKIEKKTENIDEKNELKITYEKYMRKLKETDEDEHNKIVIDEENIPFERLKLLTDNAKIILATVKEKKAWSKVYRETLTNMAHEIRAIGEYAELEESIEQVCAKKYIENSEYLVLKDRALKKICELRENADRKSSISKFADKTREKLRELGYEVEDESRDGATDDENEKFKKGEPVYFNSGDGEYRVMAKMNENGELGTRVVRLVDDISEKSKISSYQMQKDAEHAGKWCKDYDKLLHKLEEEGMKAEVKIRKEPTEEHVVYIARSGMKSNNRNAQGLQNEGTIK